MLTNPVVVSIIVMGVLCLARLNVLLAILISALVAGVLGGIGVEKSINLLISGMAGNLETALSYILLGALASAIARTNLTLILIHYIANFVQNRRLMFCLSIAFFCLFFAESHSCAYCLYSDSHSSFVAFDESLKNR